MYVHMYKIIFLFLTSSVPCCSLLPARHQIEAGREDFVVKLLEKGADASHVGTCDDVR